MNTIHGYNEVHITYDLTKMLRSIKRCEKREEEENELRSRINAYRSHRAERKAMKILWVMQKSIGLIMAIMAYIEPSCATYFVSFLHQSVFDEIICWYTESHGHCGRLGEHQDSIEQLRQM